VAVIDVATVHPTPGAPAVILSRTLVAALAAATLAAPNALAQPNDSYVPPTQDLRSPDAIDAAMLAAPNALAQRNDTDVLPMQDLRSPDAIDAATLAAPNALAQRNEADVPPTPRQDLRSPDVIDAATRPDAPTPPLPGPSTRLSHSEPAITPTTATDHRIGGTAIGLGIAASMLAAGGIAGIARSNRRRRRQRVTA
jgi:hypothetical protein